MSSTELESYRREIDEIDDAIHDLLMRRTQIVELVTQAKSGDDVFLRPGREAMILRRLAARHEGPFPLAVLVRMWREMLGAMTRLQGPFAVAVLAGDDRRGFWDLARDHFGSFIPMIPVNTPVVAVRAVSDGSATVGVIPYPEEDEPDPWWRFLMSDDGKTPRVIARLPFCGRATGRGDDRDALCVARAAPEPTGDDRSLLGIEICQDMSRGRLKEALEAAGFRPLAFRTWLVREPQQQGSLQLVEVGDFVDPQDDRLARFKERSAGAVVRTCPIGSYAVPLDAAAGTPS